MTWSMTITNCYNLGMLLPQNKLPKCLMKTCMKQKTNLLEACSCSITRKADVTFALMVKHLHQPHHLRPSKLKSTQKNRIDTIPEIRDILVILNIKQLLNMHLIRSHTLRHQSPLLQKIIKVPKFYKHTIKNLIKNRLFSIK